MFRLSRYLHFNAENMYLPPLWTSFELLLFTCFIACTTPNETKNPPQAEQSEFKVSFELKSDSIWQIPEREQKTDVYLVLEMTNLGDKPIRFPIMDKFNVSMQHPDGNELMMEGGQDVLIPGNPISHSVLSGEKYLLKISGQLDWGNANQLLLNLKDDFGSVWWIGPLETGSYLLNMYYENETKDNNNNSDLWSGKANITSLMILITN